MKLIYLLLLKINSYLLRTPVAWLQLSHQKIRLLVAILGVAFSIILIFLQESLILAVIGFIPGYLASYVVYYLMTNFVELPVSMNTDIAFKVFALNIIMCTISGAIAILRLETYLEKVTAMESEFEYSLLWDLFGSIMESMITAVVRSNLVLEKSFDFCSIYKLRRW